MTRTVIKVLASIICASMVACAGPGEPVPKGLRTYLDSLTAKEYKAAYDLTQLSELADGFGAGASLSYEHFQAFFRANPLTDYSVEQVTRLTTRPIEDRNDPGTPFFEVDMTFEYGERRSRETVTVLGEILPRVQIEPDRLFLRLPEGTERIVVDGVPTRVKAERIFDGSIAFPVLLLRGEHEFRLGEADAIIGTSPVRVVSGDASVESEGDQSSVVRIG